MEKSVVPVIIPAYEPDDKLTGLIEELRSAVSSPVIVVDDGSDTAQYGVIFEKARSLGAVVLTHAVNMGKGRALKTAFNYCLNEYRDIAGVVTADSDGQHGVRDIKAIADALLAGDGSLILGVRDFAESGVPAKSMLGNRITSKVMKFLIGISVSDTQTGLRGIPVGFMRKLLVEKGERYEFETNMLIASKDQGVPIREVKIETIYIDGNRSSHFNPVKDSFRIYVLFLKFLVSSLSSSVVDIVLFAVFCALLRDRSGLPVDHIVLSTVMARIISASYNFIINYRIVFKSKGSRTASAMRYLVLVIVIMLLSAFFVSAGHRVFPGVPEVVVKIPVDSLLFLLSFYIQREKVYK